MVAIHFVRIIPQSIVHNKIFCQPRGNENSKSLGNIIRIHGFMILQDSLTSHGFAKPWIWWIRLQNLTILAKSKRSTDEIICILWENDSNYQSHQRAKIILGILVDQNHESEWFLPSGFSKIVGDSAKLLQLEPQNTQNLAKSCGSLHL